MMGSINCAEHLTAVRSSAFLPAVVAFQDFPGYSEPTFSLPVSTGVLQFSSTTQVTFFSTHSSQESLSTSFIYFYSKYGLKGYIIFKSWFIYKCILNWYFHLNNSQSLQI